MKLSVVLITFNESANLPRTLSSVQEIADEIVIVDSYSTDDTLAIAEKFGARTVQKKWLGFGKQKNFAIALAENPWILLLDADEEVSTSLKLEIQKFLQSPTHNAASILRENFCFGKRVRHGGWKNDRVIRLFKQGVVKISDDLVHERSIASEPVLPLLEPILHHTYADFAEFAQKSDRYSSLGAKQLFESHSKPNVLDITLRPFYKFIHSYFFRLGILDGKTGLALALGSSWSVFSKYFKTYEWFERH